MIGNESTATNSLNVASTAPVFTDKTSSSWFSQALLE